MTPYEYSSLTLGLVAFAAVVWQLRMLSRSTSQDHDRRRKQATMEYLTANMDRRKALFDQGIPAERDRAVWNNCRPWIEAQREKHGEPSVYENLEWLAGHMTTLRSARSIMDAGNLPPQGQPVL